ncbi:hypothetical protein IQ13_3962 [Lacibacter cauensis]|uniref:Uncharacterized protein n=1 Tax=Lacibacter cauensis TaxID=510947 RepID=A0A562SCG8_9BACT|nr:hypothetical protein IQ13_3962 [Lacibacter cauensis]
MPVLGFLFLLNSCSSANKMLISGEAFSVEVQKGNVQVNETGEELNPTATKVVTVYLHTKTDKLLIDSAWLNNIPYTFNIQPIAQAFEIGYNSRNEKVTVKPTDKGFLYQVTIVPLLKAGEEALAEVRLRYRYRNKVFYKTVAPIVAIRPFDAQ